MAVNCLDRHLAKIGNKVAILWQGEKDEEVRKITYKELHEMVCRFTNVLLSKGVKKGDRDLRLHAHDSRRRPSRSWPAPGSGPSIPSFSGVSARNP